MNQVQRGTARIPNRITKEVGFDSLTATSLKLWLYIVYLWQKRKDKDARLLSFTWAQVSRAVTPKALRSSKHSVYSTYVTALDLLLTVQIGHSYKQGSRTIREKYNLLGGWEFNQETGHVEVYLHSAFARVLQLLEGKEGFTIAPLRDVMALDNPRHIRVLLWACMCVHLRSDELRTIPLDTIRHGMGLVGESYDDWRQVSRLLQESVESVNAKTAFSIGVKPIKRGTKIEAVRFDVTKRSRPKELPHDY